MTTIEHTVTRLRPLRPTDWRVVERLEAALFPNFSETFDQSFFQRLAGLAPKLIWVLEEKGCVVGYLSLVPLSARGVTALVHEGKTTIAEMSGDHFGYPPRSPAAYFVEVIAVAPGASRHVRYRLLREAAKRIGSLKAFDWYAIPITPDGVRLAQKFGFKKADRSEHSNLHILRSGG
jgi:hypothetical protein